MKVAGLTVVKCGGNAGTDPVAMCADIAALVAGGERVVCVNGGSSEVDRLAARLGVPQRRLTTPGGGSSRYTDAPTLEVFTTALAGVVLPRMVTELARHGVAAVGLTGLDAGILTASRHAPHRAVVDGVMRVVRDDHTGRLAEVRTDLLELLLAAGITPLLSPPARTAAGAAVNVDADRVAGLLAARLSADRLVFLTGTEGVLADPDDPGSLLAECVVPASGFGGGMAVKLTAAAEALAAGVADVRIASGAGEAPVARALAGGGTRAVRSSEVTGAVASTRA